MALDQLAVSAPDPMAETYSFSAPVPSNGIQIVNENGQFDNIATVPPGSAMNAFGGGFSIDGKQLHQSGPAQVTFDQTAFENCTMLGMTEIKMEPAAGGGIGGLFGELCSQFGDQIQELSNAINDGPAETQPVPKAMEYEVHAIWSRPALGGGPG